MTGILAIALATSGCGKKTTTSTETQCAPVQLASGLGATGSADVFDPDPIVHSGNSQLAPTSVQLDDYRSQVSLERLDGTGVLAGQYVDIRDGVSCDEGYGAFDQGNQFTYTHDDTRFSEAMAYYFGDRYRANLATAGNLTPSDPVRIVAHCMQDDNAYFERYTDPNTQQVVQKVCLGDSVATPGASYADDAEVIVHELEHSATIDTYSPTVDLNRFWYDEAGAMNEAISDYMALAYFDPEISSQFDPRLFSRWALGTFIPDHNGTRGSNKCPAYDSHYPDCSSYPSFSADSNTVSYVYPDGLGWPYANNFDRPGLVSSAYSTYKSQEEIHNADEIIVGALWDSYAALKAAHDAGTADQLMTKAVLSAVGNLPKPTLNDQSPVTFRGFASTLVSVAPQVGFSSSDVSAMTAALTTRGLLGDSTAVTSGWASLGNPAMKIQDNPSTLKTWFSMMGTDPTIVPQGITTGLNGKADPGEVIAVWFNISDSQANTAGGLLVTVTSPDPDVVMMDENYNIGAISNTAAQIRYLKVNGTSVVSALTSSNQTMNVPTANTYFLTNPFFDHNWTTAIFMQISPTAAHGKTVNLQLQVEPSNGTTETLTAPLTIN